MLTFSTNTVVIMKRLTESQVIEELSAKGVKLIEWAGTIRGVSTIQPPCGHIIKTSLKTFRNNVGACARCAGRAKYTLETAVESLDGKGISIRKWGGAASSQSTFECSKGHEWQTTLSLVLHGTGCPQCSGNVVLPETVVREKVTDKGFELVSYAGRTNRHGSIVKCSKGHEWVCKINYIIHGTGTGCPHCCAHGPSTHEREVFEFVKSFAPDAVQSYRKLISPKEVDIYVPSHNLAIEFNGLYWHSEEYHDKKYHVGKRLAVETTGNRLISIREDLWRERKSQVQNIILNALGASGASVGARKTQIVSVSSAEAREFMSANHVQGFKNATVHLGLSYNGTLVAVLSLTHWLKSAEWEVARYATSVSVMGGLSKLWKHAVKLMNIQNAYTYIDRDLFTGNAYVAIGFERVSSTVGFRVVTGCTTESRQKWNKAPRGTTQSEWYSVEGVRRIYDSGQDKLIFRD